jgi:hypothetical protein
MINNILYFWNIGHKVIIVALVIFRFVLIFHWVKRRSQEEDEKLCNQLRPANPILSEEEEDLK